MPKSSIFELQNCNLHQEKGHFNLHILHYCLKTFEVAIALRKPKNSPHARTSQVSTKMGSQAHIATCYCTSQLAIAHRKSCLGLILIENGQISLKICTRYFIIKKYIYFHLLFVHWLFLGLAIQKSVNGKNQVTGHIVFFQFPFWNRCFSIKKIRSVLFNSRFKKITST